MRSFHFESGPPVYKLPYRNLVPEEKLDLFPQGEQPLLFRPELPLPPGQLRGPVGRRGRGHAADAYGVALHSVMFPLLS